MPIMKKAVNENFTVVHNTFINDHDVDWDGKGMLLYMLSKPDRWKFSIKGLATQTKSGEHKVSSILKNLKEAGYLKMQRERSENGSFTEMVYYYSDEPIFKTDEEDNSEKNNADTQFEPHCENRNMGDDIPEKKVENEVQPHCGFPDVDNPDVGNPNVGNSDLDNPDVNNRQHNKYCNNQILNNQILYNQSIYQSNTEIQKNDRPIDGLAERKMYEEQIKENIEYDWFVERYEANDTKEVYGSQELLDSTVEIMLDCMCSTEDIKVGKQFFSPEVVRSRFMKINGEHINHLFERLEKYSESITNIKSYMITALYDVSVTMPIGEHVDIKTMFR